MQKVEFFLLQLVQKYFGSNVIADLEAAWSEYQAGNPSAAIAEVERAVENKPPLTFDPATGASKDGTK